MRILVLILAGCGTALATGLGAIPVHLLRSRAHVLARPLTGVAAGVMSVASVLGLLKPGFDQGPVSSVLLGVLTGVAFLWLTRRALRAERGTVHALKSPDATRSVLIFVVLFAHSLPEGFAVGTAYASQTAGLGLFVILAIAIQNVPEGTSIAVPMQAAGYGFWTQFWAAVGTSATQPVGAVVAYLAVERVASLLPLSFGFAAGAMLALVVVDLGPEAFGGPSRVPGVLGIAGGAVVMSILSLLLGV